MTPTSMSADRGLPGLDHDENGRTFVGSVDDPAVCVIPLREPSEAHQDCNARGASLEVELFAVLQVQQCWVAAPKHMHTCVI